LHWDGEVVYQSTRDEQYTSALRRLAASRLLYPCICTRREIAEGPIGLDGPIYPGTCRAAISTNPQGRHAYRVRVTDEEVCFTDRVRGSCSQQLSKEVGDFVLRRSDGLFAYQLAVVVDDAAQEITEVVRGADLLSSTPRQIYLQKLLGLPSPSYLHVPLLTDGSGLKLSKQNKARSIADVDARVALFECLSVLGLRPPAHLAASDPEQILAWGVREWSPAGIPNTAVLAPTFARTA
jgi:glutamyl-Q tRNA(Asp) synthetase